MRHLRLVVVLLTVIACATSGPAASGPRGAGPLDDAVRAARLRWNNAIAAHDTTPLRDLLADSILQASPYFSRVGKENYITGFARQFASRPRFLMVYAPDQIDVQVVVNDTLAMERGHWHETWLESGDPTDMRGNYFAIWRRRGRGWQIVREVFAPTTCVGLRYCHS